jgi:hypothetical protein
MGLFFDEEKKVVTEAKPEHHGFFAAAFLMLLGWILALLGWIFKPLFTWLFDFRDTTKEIAIIKVSIIFTLLCGTIFGLWQFQVFRDLTLSKSHTLNRNTTGTKIPFPDSSYFVTEGNYRLLELDNGSSKKYLTYSGYTKYTAKKVRQGTCALVPRNEAAVFSSDNLPVEAEGCVDTVEYTIEQKLTDLPFLRYVKEIASHPRYLFTNANEKAAIVVAYRKEATWGEFGRDWDDLFSFPGGYKPFEVRAKFYEHAIVCF